MNGVCGVGWGRRGETRKKMLRRWNARLSLFRLPTAAKRKAAYTVLACEVLCGYDGVWSTRLASDILLKCHGARAVQHLECGPIFAPSLK